MTFESSTGHRPYLLLNLSWTLVVFATRQPTSVTETPPLVRLPSLDTFSLAAYASDELSSTWACGRPTYQSAKWSQDLLILQMFLGTSFESCHSLDAVSDCGCGFAGRESSVNIVPTCNPSVCIRPMNDIKRCMISDMHKVELLL